MYPAGQQHAGLLPGHPPQQQHRRWEPMHSSPACSAEHTGCFPGSRLSLAAFPAPQDTARSKLLSPGWLLKTQSNPPVKRAAAAKFPLFLLSPFQFAGSQRWVWSAASPADPCGAVRKPLARAVGTSLALKAAPSRFLAASRGGIAGNGGNLLLLCILTERKKKN